MRRLADAREQADTWRGVETRSQELEQLLDLATEESDEDLSQAVAADIDALASQLEGMELSLALSGEYDRRDAILAIHAGAGGTDSRTGPRCSSACTSAGPTSAATRPTCST